MQYYVCAEALVTDFIVSDFTLSDCLGVVTQLYEITLARVLGLKFDKRDCALWDGKCIEFPWGCDQPPPRGF